MAASRKVGKPPINDPNDVAAIELKIETYFNGLVTDDAVKPPTFNGLSLALGYTSRTTLWNNANAKSSISEPIKRAMARIEEAYEERLFSQSPTGAIFALKNRGWTDKQEVEHSGTMTVKTQDLSKLSYKELKELEALAAKIESTE